MQPLSKTGPEELPPRKSRANFSFWLVNAAVAALFGWACFALRRFGIPGGDTGSLMGDYFDYLWSSNYAYLRREPGAHAIVYIVSRYLVDRALTLSWVGAVSGGVYLFLLLGRSRRWLFLLPSIVSIMPFNFVGHLEFYAPVAVALAAFFLSLWKALESPPRSHPGRVCAWFSIAFFMHKVTFIFFPLLGLLHLRWRRREGIGRRVWPARAWVLGVAALLAVSLVDLMAPIVAEFNLFQIRMIYVYDSDSLLTWLTPLTPGMARWLESTSILGTRFLFTFGQPAHWAHFFGSVLISAPLAWPVIFALRRRLRGDAAWGLLAAALIGLAWTLVWHPHQGWLDWDLFSMASIPANLLAGGLLADLFRAEEPAAA